MAAGTVAMRSSRVRKSRVRIFQEKSFFFVFNTMNCQSPFCVPMFEFEIYQCMEKKESDIAPKQHGRVRASTKSNFRRQSLKPRIYHANIEDLPFAFLGKASRLDDGSFFLWIRCLIKLLGRFSRTQDII